MLIVQLFTFTMGRMKSLKFLFQTTQRLKRSHILPSNCLGAGGLVGWAISCYPVVAMGLQRKSAVWHPDLLSHKSWILLKLTHCPSIKSQCHQCKQRSLVWFSQHQVFSKNYLRKHWSFYSADLMGMCQSKEERKTCFSIETLLWRCYVFITGCSSKI